MPTNLPNKNTKLQSMTGFASVTEHLGDFLITVELKSVNHRFLEIYFKIPDTIRLAEHALKERVKQVLKRGKIDCFIKLEQNNEGCPSFSLNQELAKVILDAAAWVKKENPSAQINAFDLLKWPGVMTEKIVDAPQIEPLVLQVFDKTLKTFLEMRAREGAEIKKTLDNRLKLIEFEINKVKKLMPEILVWQDEKLRKKLEPLNQDIDLLRLEQELLYTVQRIDVAEELDRLEMHIKETYQILEKGEGIGRRLDFMMQEFNREANTLASKSISSEVTQSAVEIKVLIEQMREQIQNLE